MKFDWESKFIVKYRMIIGENFHALSKFDCLGENYRIK